MPWEAILAVLAFVAGALFLDKKRKNQQVDDALDRADEQARRDKEDAERRYKERLARARAAADASVADRPSTDDPVADLRDRLDR